MKIPCIFSCVFLNINQKYILYEKKTSEKPVVFKYRVLFVIYFSLLFLYIEL